MRARSMIVKVKTTQLVNNMTFRLEISGVDNFVESILFITIKILRLASVTRVYTINEDDFEYIRVRYFETANFTHNGRIMSHWA